jgi:hypothetical protein
MNTPKKEKVELYHSSGWTFGGFRNVPVRLSVGKKWVDLEIGGYTLVTWKRVKPGQVQPQ